MKSNQKFLLVYPTVVMLRKFLQYPQTRTTTLYMHMAYIFALLIIKLCNYYARNAQY